MASPSGSREPIQFDHSPAGSRPGKPAPPHGLRHESRVLLLALASGAVGVAVALLLLWTGDYSSRTQWTLTFLVVAFWLGFAFSLRDAVIRPLQTLSNMQAALREGDFSIRARGARHDDSLGELMFEVNTLSQALREQRLGAMEATALLRKVMEEIDVAVFAFDGQHRLQLVNRAGERLLGQPAERLHGATAADLNLEEFLAGDPAVTVDRAFAGGTGRWGIRRSNFRQAGVPHQLLVISDLSRALREEERQAWQRLVRVLGHELNNSLAPIRSIAESLDRALAKPVRGADWEQDLRGGLRVIAERSEALSRFMRDYARLARLPKPQLQPVELEPMVRRVVALETRMRVEVHPGPGIRLHADRAQLEQLLINLIRNAVDAALETGGGVTLGWTRGHAGLEVVVEDEGPGILNGDNLFVPFFTTKPGGSGIGLALGRQIAEAHGGMLTLENRRKGTRGCEARLRLPL